MTHLVKRGDSGTYPVIADTPEQAVALMNKLHGPGWTYMGVEAAPKPVPAYTYSADVERDQRGRDPLDEGE